MAYRKVYFRIRTECYSSGWSSDADRAAFKEESRRLFQELGWTVTLGCNGGCDTMTKDCQDLYLHPSSFSGVLDEDNIQSLKEQLAQARTFRCYHVDRYEEYRDLNDDEYRAELEAKLDEITAYKFMTGLELPSTLKTIANSAFSGCRALEELNLPDGLTSIGQEAFNYCRALTSLRIPESVTDVGNKAFANCDRLKYAVLSIDIGSSMFDKGNYVDDLQLATVSIAKGTTGIGYAAFSNCKNLSAIIVDAETLNNLCTSKNGTNHLPGANYPSSPSFSAAYYVIGDSVDASVLTELSKATAIKVCGADAQVDVETLRVVVNGQEVTEWEAKEDGTQVPKVEKPDPVVPVLGDALEDNNGLTLTQNASLIDAENKYLAQMLKLSTDWNDKNQGHASIPDVSAFKSGAFTVILDVQPDSSLSTETWKRTALTIGNKENKLRLLNAAGLLGYGADQTNDGKSNGTCKDWKTRIFGGFTVTSRQFYITFHKFFLIRRAGRLFTFYCWPQRVMEGGPQHDLN